MQTSIYSLLMSYYYVCVCVRERERERERGIQLCNMADGTTAVGTVAFDRWVVHWVLQISIIYCSSATWVSTYVPQCHCLCIPLLEYWVQCSHCHTILNIVTSLSHAQMIWPKCKDVPDSKICFDIKQNSNSKFPAKRPDQIQYIIYGQGPRSFLLYFWGLDFYVTQGLNPVYNYRWLGPSTLFFFPM